MKTVAALLMLLVAGFLVAGTALDAGEKGKEVTLKGKLVCGKCTLSKTDKCANVLQVGSVEYYLKDKGKAEAYHKAICPSGKSVDATVTGVVSEKDGKKYVKVNKIDVK